MQSEGLFKFFFGLAIFIFCLVTIGVFLILVKIVLLFTPSDRLRYILRLLHLRLRHLPILSDHHRRLPDHPQSDFAVYAASPCHGTSYRLSLST